MKTSPLYLFVLFLWGSLSMPQEKKIMVFGVFDLLHAGHINFLEQAHHYGDTLIVVVTRDEMVAKLKKRRPVDSQEKRLAQVQNVPGVSKAVLGDEELGSYAVIREYKPDVICLGYDQQGFAAHLEHVMKQGQIPLMPVHRMQPFEPDKYHSSIIRKTLQEHQKNVT